MKTFFVAISLVLTIANFIGSGMTLIAIIWGRLAKKTAFLLIAFLAVCDVVYGVSLFMRDIMYDSMNLVTCRVVLNITNFSTFFSTSGMLMLIAELYYNHKTIEKSNGIALFKKWQHAAVGILIIILFFATLTSLSTTYGTVEKDWLLHGIQEQECLNDKVMNMLTVRLFDGIVMMIYIATMGMFALLFCEIHLNRSCHSEGKQSTANEVNAEEPSNADNIIITSFRDSIFHIDHRPNDEQNFLMRTEFRNGITKLVFAMMILHTVTWLPFLIVAYLRHMSKIAVPDNVMHWPELLYSLNSIGKFVLYSVLSSDLRMMYKKIICKFSVFNEKMYFNGHEDLV